MKSKAAPAAEPLSIPINATPAQVNQRNRAFWNGTTDCHSRDAAKKTETLRCKDCGKTFKIPAESNDPGPCPSCGSQEVHLISDEAAPPAAPPAPKHPLPTAAEAGASHEQYRAKAGVAKPLKMAGLRDADPDGDDPTPEQDAKVSSEEALERAKNQKEQEDRR